MIFNQYSAVWIAAFLMVIVGLFLFRRRPKWPQFLTFGVLLLGLVAGWFFIHPTQTSLVDSASNVQANIGKGTPVLLEFQSPY